MVGGAGGGGGAADSRPGAILLMHTCPSLILVGDGVVDDPPGIEMHVHVPFAL